MFFSTPVTEWTLVWEKGVCVCTDSRFIETLEGSQWLGKSRGLNMSLHVSGGLVVSFPTNTPAKDLYISTPLKSGCRSCTLLRVDVDVSRNRPLTSAYMNKNLFTSRLCLKKYE